MVVDAHFDLAAEVYERRLAGERHVVERRYLPHFREASVNLIVSSIYVPGRELPESGLRRALGQIAALREDLESVQDQICVADAWRRKGVGRQLLRAFLLDARQAGAIPCVRAHLYGTESAGAALRRAAGFTIDEPEDTVCRFPLSAIPDKLLGDSKIGQGSSVRLSEVPTDALQRFNARMALRDALPIPQPVRARDYHKDLSFAVLNHGEIAGLLLAEQHADELYLAFLYAAPNAPRAAAVLLLRAVQEAKALYPAETAVQLAAVSPAAGMLVDKILPCVSRQRGVTAEYWL